MTGSQHKPNPTGGRAAGELTPSPPTATEPDQISEGSPRDSVGEHPATPVEGVAARVQIAHSLEVSSGPLPHPESFRAYEQTLRGAADRILTMAEKQQGNRHARQSARLSADISRESRGQWMGFVVVMTGMMIGMTLILFDRSVEGVATALGAIGGVSGLFMWSRRNRSRTPPNGSPQARQRKVLPAPPPPPLE